MRNLSHPVAQFLKNENGPTGVEYAMIFTLIIVVCITAFALLGPRGNAPGLAGPEAATTDE
jgi:pilus assembly protein Flp/PilA